MLSKTSEGLRNSKVRHVDFSDCVSNFNQLIEMNALISFRLRVADRYVSCGCKITEKDNQFENTRNI